MSRSATRTRARAAIALAIAAWLGAPVHAQRPAQGDDDSAALVSAGRAALRRGALGDAARALDEAIALNPRRIEAYVLRAAVHAAAKDYRAGIAVMRRAQALAPGDQDVLTQLGSQLVLAGDPGAGVPLLEQVVATNPARYDAQLLLGHHWHDGEQWQRAIAAFEAYFAHRPAELASDDVRHRVDLADAYLRSGQPARSLARLTEPQRGAPDLRTRLAIAWATAALDCGRARRLLRELEAAAPTHPEIWLVDGRCALALGDPAAAIERGRRYTERSSRPAAGHALVGEAHAARGNLVAARRELEVARALEPARRPWVVRLAAVVRRGGDPRAAVALLDELGPPGAPDDEPAWWRELGEALLAAGDAAQVQARLAPVAAQLPGDGELASVLGAAQLALGQPGAAIATLERAHGVAPGARSRRLLARALTTAAAGELAAGDAAAAEALLVRAEPLESSPAVLRDLGIARLILGRLRDAQATLDRAIALDPAPLTVMLAARARALAGDVTGARPLYLDAFDAGRDAPEIAAEIALDWAASELDGGDPLIAVAALERIADRVRPGPLARRHRAALAQARHAAGIAALAAGNPVRAAELIKQSVATEPAVAALCDLALAAIAAGDGGAATAALAQLPRLAEPRGDPAAAARDVRCPFPAPADVQAVAILRAFADGLDPKRAGRALDRLTALAARASGPARRLVGTAIRIVALEAAGEAYRSGKLADSRALLRRAQAAGSAVAGDELALGRAVVELADASTGALAATIAELERLAPRLPEAWIAAGIAHERAGQPRKALDAWQRARKAGSRFAPLADWIAGKQRIYGADPGDPP